ncbi:MAG: hypothetical protein Q7S32_04150 [bacterium]|nr:hypothetical protein [bacterium]
MSIETQPGAELDLDQREEFKLRVDPKQGEIPEKERELELQDHSELLMDAIKNRYSTESEVGRNLGHSLVTLLEHHDPEKNVVKKKKLQADFDKLRNEMTDRANTLMPREKAELQRRRDILIDQLDTIDKLIEPEYAFLRNAVSDYKTAVRPEEYDSFLAGFVAEYAFAKACDLEQYNIYYSTDKDDRSRKVDWWAQPGRENDKKEEEIYGIQVKTLRVPGMKPEITTIRTIDELSSYIKELVDKVIRNPEINQFNRKAYLNQLEKIRGQSLTLFRNCANIRALRQEGKSKPAEVKPALVIIPGEIARFDKSTGLPSENYVQSIRDRLLEILEEE